VVDALTRIQAALVPGGLLVDTQPIGERLPVALAGKAIGELEGEEWLDIVAAVDAETDKAIGAGLFEPRHEERYVVVHEFGSGSEALEEAGSWAGTRVPHAVVERLNPARGRVEIEHDVRLRLLVRP
jgi:hypothetical protein